MVNIFSGYFKDTKSKVWGSWNTILRKRWQYFVLMSMTHTNGNVSQDNFWACYSQWQFLVILSLNIQFSPWNILNTFFGTKMILWCIYFVTYNENCFLNKLCKQNRPQNNQLELIRSNILAFRNKTWFPDPLNIGLWPLECLQHT